MRHVARCMVIFISLVTILSVLALGCSSETTQVQKIKIGYLTDLTGSMSGITRPSIKAFEDAVRYVNEETPPLEGVRFEIVYADQRSDDSLNVTLYNRLKEQGCQIIISTPAPFADTVKPFAERDKIVILALASSEAQVNPPGWVFAVPPPSYGQVKTLLEWVSEEDWDYTTEGRKPKVGFVAWDESYETDMAEGLKDYVAANPDKFELGRVAITPLGTYTFLAEIEQVKDCDYVFIPPIGLAPAQFAKDFRDRGYTAKFLGTETIPAFKNIVIDKAGWDYMDGTLTGMTSPYWTDDFTIMEQALTSLNKYHSGSEAVSLKNDTVAYSSNYPTAKMLMDLLVKVVKDKGSADITGQDIYDAAIAWSSDSDGETRDWSDTDRLWRDSMAIYEWRASDQDLFRVSEFLPLLD